MHGHSDRVTTATAIDVTHAIRIQNRVYVTLWPKAADHRRFVNFLQARVASAWVLTGCVIVDAGVPGQHLAERWNRLPPPVPAAVPPWVQ